MGILPTRPLRLDDAYLAKLSRSSWLLTAFLAAIAAGVSFASVYITRQILAERELWEHGVTGEVRDISGTVRTNRKLGVTLNYHYKLKVEYVDQAGSAHRGRTEFDLFWTPIEGDLRSGSLRYDPADPERFVLSFPIDAGPARWGLAILTAALAAFVWSCAVAARRSHSLSQHRLELAALDGEELLAPLCEVRKERSVYRVVFSLPDCPGKVDEVLLAEPLVVELDKIPHVVVLRSLRDPRGRVVIQADLAGFAFDPATKAAILERAASAE